MAGAKKHVFKKGNAPVRILSLNRYSAEGTVTKTYDAVIVGAGHNGLVCGAYLAKAGLSVCIVERRDIVGGAAVTEQIIPGFRSSAASYVMSLLQPNIILELGLPENGFEVLPVPPVFHPLDGGRHVFFFDEEHRAAAEFERISPGDGDAFLRYRSHLRSLKPYMQRLLWEVPVDLADRSLSGAIDIAKFAWRFRDIGDRFYEIYDLLTMSAYDYLGRWFKSDEVKTVIGFYAGCAGGHFTSPKTAGTAFVLIRPVLRDSDTAAGTFGFMKGGMGAISDSIARVARKHGVEIRTNAPVASIITQHGQAVGVALEDGEEIRAKIVVTNASARTTFTKLVGKSDLTPEFQKGIENLRSESSSFKLNIAVDRLTDFTGFDPAEAGFAYPVQVRIAPSMDYMVKAMEDTREYHFSPNPVLLFMTPSVVDPTLAPEGKHVVNVFGNHAPYSLKGTTWDEQREPLFANALRTIESYAPGFGGAILGAETLTPLDLERRYDLPSGHIHHAEITTDQIFFKRPVPSHADYRSPVEKLYLCGASNHPGGGVTGVPGHNAAKVILSDRGWR